MIVSMVMSNVARTEAIFDPAAGSAEMTGPTIRASDQAEDRDVLLDDVDRGPAAKLEIIGLRAGEDDWPPTPAVERSPTGATFRAAERAP